MRKPSMIENLETRKLLTTIVQNPDGSAMGTLETYVPPGGIQYATPSKPGHGTADGAPGFQITLDFSGGGLTASQQAVFVNSAARWQAIITADIPDVGGIDDLRISASGTPIDGVNGILGQAGPTGLRSGSDLPYSGTMQFDTADLANLESNGSLNNVITHEMGHVLGLGTIWADLGLTAGAGTSSSRYLGAASLAQYKAFIRSTTATSVPLETTGGAGTADGHWSEATFNNELMTGYINSGSNPLSRMTAASFIDIGYPGVNVDAAESFTRSNDIPVIGALSANPSSLPSSGPVTLTVASGTDANGISTVSFYRESNGIPGLQATGSVTLDTLVATATGGALSAVVPAGGFASGANTVYARAADPFGLVSNVASTVVSIGGTVLVPSAPSAPDLAAAADTGYSSTDNITRTRTLVLNGTADAGTTVTVTQGTNVLGTTLASAGGSWTFTTASLVDGTYTFNATAANAAGSGPTSGDLTVTIDNVAPVLLSSAYDRNLTQDIRLTTGEGLAPLDAGSAGTLRNNTTSTNIAIDRVLLGNTASTSVASVQVDALLPNGNYTYTLPANTLSDIAGNPVATAVSLNFRQIAGDADNSGAVNFNDLLTVSQNYGQTGRNFSQGNFDYSADGLVDFNDLLILSQNYGVSLFASGSLIADTAATTATAKAKSAQRQGVAASVLV